jgi:lyso-ornithine lipid O-acyltransferase
MSLARAARVLAVAVPLVLFTLILLPAQYLAVRQGWALGRIIPVWWHRLAFRLIGGAVRVVGAPPAARPLLIVANHVSWLDILVIGSRLPVSFVAKSEVAGWGPFGLLAKLQRTVFVDRARRTSAGRGVDEIAGRFAAGEAIVLFAEGTSHDGDTVLPFRSALLAAAHASEATVQPLAVAYVARRGIALTSAERARFAWMGDADLAPSLLDAITGGPFTAELRFGTPRPGDADRKTLAHALRGEVATLLADANTGRHG